MLSPLISFSLLHYLSYGECEEDFAVVASGRIVLREEGGSIPSSLIFIISCSLSLERRPHLTRAKAQYATNAAENWH